MLKEHLIAEGLDAERILLPGLDECVALTVEAELKPAPVRERRSRVAPSEMATDWYNDYASLLLRLGRRLEAMDDHADRRALLNRLDAVLKEDGTTR